MRRKGGEPVTIDTVFQIGSISKSFLATTIAIGVDRKMLAWDDRVVDLYPEFQMKDPWVWREFRVFDLLAQRSGLAGGPTISSLSWRRPQQMIRALRFADPVSQLSVDFWLHEPHAYCCAAYARAPSRCSRLGDLRADHDLRASRHE